MRRYCVGYLTATRHPWPCLLFLVPLLVIYEAGVVWLGGAQAETLRNGADTWLRWGLDRFGLHQCYCIPFLVLAIFLAWNWFRSWDRPVAVPSIWFGMALESMLFAPGLCVFSRALCPLLEQMGIRLSLGAPQPGLSRVITFVGAGIYEEVLFRLVLCSALGLLLRLTGMPSLMVEC
jgi:hypothetical protein